MRLLQLLLLTLVAAIALLAPIVLAADTPPEQTTLTLPPGTLNAQEIEALFIGKTVESTTAVQGRVSLSYYDPNGEVRQLRLGEKRLGRWRISADGRICLQMEESREKCRIIVKEKGGYKKYIVKKNGDHQHTISYRAFKPGNPMGL
jgi:hypothetical protein